MFAPTLDGANGFLPSLPNAILQSGKYAKIPFITGDVLDEGELMRGLPSRVLG
jgi:acetylcholinesterase